MQVTDNVAELKEIHDFTGAVQVLEQAIRDANDLPAPELARLHLEAGELLSEQLGEQTRALKHFQDAFKLDPTCGALVHAVDAYWICGKRNMVRKLLELDARSESSPENLAALADVLVDFGEFDKAAKMYDRALSMQGCPVDVAQRAQDLAAGEDEWSARSQEILEDAAGDGAEALALAHVRAARLANRFDAEAAGQQFQAAYRAYPLREVAVPLEQAWIEQGAREALLTEQQQILETHAEHASYLALQFGLRWLFAWEDPATAEAFFTTAVERDPGNPQAFSLLVRCLREGSRFDEVLKLAERASAGLPEVPAKGFLLQVAGLVAWRDLDNLDVARSFFERLAQLNPAHPTLTAFADESGVPLTNSGKKASVSPAEPSDAASPEATPAEATPKEPPKTVEQETQNVADDSDNTSAEESATEGGDAEATESAGVSEGELAELREKVASLEGGRPHDYVKAVVALAEALPPSDEKVEHYLMAAELYTSKFKNQAEAVKAYESVLEVDPTHHEAVEFLRDSYEKRRDWEKLIGLKQLEASRLDGEERLAVYKDIAQLASDRIKKPAVCVELWAVVLEADPNDVDALRALSQLYERDRSYEQLADVLERLVEFTDDLDEKTKLLQKLGQVAGDRLKDDARAAEAYRMLLTLEPDDRRYQEQLKKRYLALGRWDELEMFYAQTERWDEFIRILESNESKTKDTEQRLGMLFKVAELWMTQKGKPDRAARAYEKILSIDEQNEEAADRLIPIYSAANNAKGLSGAIEVKLAHVTDPDLKLELLRQVAELYQGRANDKAMAFERLLEAFQLNPSDAQSQEDVENAAKLTGSWTQLVEAYEGAIEQDDETGIQLRLRLGRILVDEVEDVDAALSHYRAVCEAEPENEQALEALEKLYVKTDRPTDLLDVYQRRAELTVEPEQRKQILFEIAKLYDSKLEQPEDAISTFQTVLAEDPADVAALAALDDLYQRTEQWEPYADVLARRIEFEGSEQALLDLKYRLARAQEKHLDEAEAALENYREILFINQEHEGARAALEAMLKGELSAQAAAILENIYEVSGEWEKLIQALEILVKTTTEPSRRVELLRKVAINAATQLGDPSRAFDAQARAVKTDPTLAEAREELEHFAELANTWESLEKLYDAIADELDDAALKRDYWLRLAAIQERRGEVDEAAASYEHLLELDPADSQALHSLDSLFRGAERWKDLVAVYRKRIELSLDDAERETLYAEMAEILVQRLEQPDLAIAAYQEVLEFAPASGVALGALDALYTGQERWSDLAENLTSRLALEETEHAQLELMLRLAALREQKMQDTQAAVEGYRQVLDRDPLNETALGALERLGQDPENELMIAEILEPLYRDQGNYQKLIGVYEVQERREPDPMNKVNLLHQIAALYEDAAGDINAAFDTYCRALAVDPSTEATLDGLDRLARSTGRFEDLAAHFEKLGEAQEEPELSSQLYTLAARTVENDVRDTDRAIELYRKVLSIDPVNLDAAQSLQNLFQIADRSEDTSLILQRKAEILDDLDAQKEALYQAALIEQEVLGRAEKAIAVYHKVLELDEEDLRSVDALIELYLGLEKWAELLEVQSKKADLVLDSDEKKMIFYQMGSVYERELNDLNKATDTYQRVLELDPDDLEALGRLDALYLATENWQELLSVLTQESELAADADEAISYQYRIAELYEKRLEDVPRAVELYREILNIQPAHGPTLAALEGIKGGQREPLAAAMVLEPVYEATGEFGKLIGTLEVQVSHTEEPFAQVELFHRIATLYEESLGDYANAFETYARAVAVDCRNEDTLAALERLAMSLGRWAEVASLYASELEKLEEPDARVELGLRVAQIYQVQLEDVDNSVARYRQVLEVDPENHPALRALDRLFVESERWDELVAILERQAEVGETPEEILDFKYRLGQVRQYQLQEIDAAIEAYSEVLNAAPEHLASREALEGLFDQGVKQLQIGETLEPLYQASGEFDKLIQVHRAQLTHIEDPQQRLELYYRIADDAEEHLADASGAFDVYAQALAEQPLDERVGQEIERLADMLDEGWVKLAVCYADVVSQEGISAQVQAALGKRLARVYEEELADPDKAKESYRFVLSVAPGDSEALENLDRIYLSFEEWPELAEVLEQRAQVSEDTHDQVEFLTRLGEVYEERLAQLDDAERAYRRIFDELELQNESAIEALERIFEQKESWTELARVYERQLEVAVGDVEESEIRAKMARLSWQRLGQVDAAIDNWKRVLELRGEDGEALTGLADLYEHQQQWAELSDVLERHYENADTDEDRVFALSRRARLFSDQLGRDDEALETWHRVLDIEFSNVDALRAIAAIWRRREDAQELVQALHNFVEQGAAQIEPEELTALFRELGKTYGDVLEQPFEAAEAWTRLLEVDPGDFEALAELEKLYRADDRWEDVVQVKIQRAAAFEDPAEKIRELLEVTDLWREQLENYDGATEAYAKVLEVDPLHQVAFDEIEKLHKAAARWEQLIEAYLGRLEHVEEVSVRSELWRRMARVFEDRLEDNEQAFVALDQAFKEDFHDDTTAEYLGRMAQATGRWKELIADTQQLLEGQTQSRDRIQLCLRLGKWYGEDLGLMDYANAYYQQVAEMDPGNVQVRRQMANIYRLAGNYPQAGQTLREAEQAAVKNEDRKMIYVDMGDLLRKHMGDPDQSIVYYKRALGVDAHLIPALEALQEIYSDKRENTELAQILKRKVEALTDPDALADTKLQLAELYEHQLKDLDRAAEVYSGVVDLDGTNITALRGLERVHEALQHWAELVEVLEKQLLSVQSERERVEVLLKLAGILEEQFLKADVAAQRLEQALEIDSTEKRAYEGLARCYRRLKAWEELVSTYERHINEAADAQVKVDLYANIGQVHADETGDVEQAIMAYQSIVDDLDENNIVALDALAKLYDKRGDTHESIECLRRVADLTTDGSQYVDMYYRIGKVQLEKLEDRFEARESFEKALDRDPAHLPSLAALRQIATEEADWDAAARYLEQEQAHTESSRSKARLLVELGKVREEHLDEPEMALQAYEQAMEADPECEEAAMPLVSTYVEKERWAEAEPLAELLVRRSKNLDRVEQHNLHNTLGRIQAALGKNEDALEAYQSAYQLDVTSQESIRGIAEVSFRLKDWPTALTNYQKVLTALGEDELEERTEVYFRLGCIKREQGQAKQAINNFEKALALNGEHRPTLDALVEIYEGQNDLAQVAEYKRQILDSVFDEDPRFALLVEIGDVWGKQDGQIYKAIDAYEEAYELRPQDHVLLHRLLQAYQKAEEWSKMIDTIQSIADLEDEPDKKARYFYTMAQLYRDKSDDPDRAVELFNETLDLNPSFLEAFERINKILTASKNWKQLERNYRKMLHRIAGKGETDLEHELWYQLGLIYRDRIQDRERAVDAFKMASRAKPDDMRDRRILSELYEVTEQFDNAIEEQQYILSQDPLKLDPHRALYRLYLHKRDYDAAWCSAAAMAFMRKAEPEEQRFYEDYRPEGILQVKGRLNDELWLKHLFHEKQNIYISKILEAVAGAALKAKIAQLGPNYRPPDKKFKQDVATSTITFARTFGWAAQVLNVPIPELYVRNDQPGAITALATEPRASEAGRTVLSGFQPPELAFICGKHLATYRPELYIRNLFPAHSDLMVMLFAGVTIAAPKTPLPQELATNVRSTAQALAQFMDAQTREYLRTVVKRFIEDGAKANIKRWNQGAELTACRAALLVCGDLEIAKKLISAERASPDLSAADKMKELLTFSVGSDYLALRKALGVNIVAE